MADLIAQVAAEDAASMPVFDTTYLNLLLDDASTLSFRGARPEVIIKDSVVVRQDFDLCDEIPTKSAFWNCTAVLERCLNEALSLMAPCPLVPPLRLNDLIVAALSSGFSWNLHLTAIMYDTAALSYCSFSAVAVDITFAQIVRETMHAKLSLRPGT